MRKVLAIAVWVVLLAGCMSVEEALQKPADLRVLTRHNHVTGDSMWLAPRYYVEGGPTDRTKLPHIEVAGAVRRLASGPSANLLVFYSNSRDWRFLRNRDVAMLIDGSERIALGEATHEGDVVPYGGVSVNETLVVLVSDEQLRRIGRARSVEVQLGGAQFSLRPATVKVLAELALIAETR